MDYVWFLEFKKEGRRELDSGKAIGQKMFFISGCSFLFFTHEIEPCSSLEQKKMGSSDG
jgi:hypothetical protein